MVQHASKLTLRRLGNELKEKASKTHRGDLSRNGQAGEHLLQANSISLKAYQTCVWGPKDLRKRGAKKAKECLEARRLREANESFTNAMRSSLEEKAKQRRTGEIVCNFYLHLQATIHTSRQLAPPFVNPHRCFPKERAWNHPCFFVVSRALKKPDAKNKMQKRPFHSTTPLLS